MVRAKKNSYLHEIHVLKFINPNNDGTVLPILHLNGYKISNPTIFARIPTEEMIKFFEGCGWAPILVEGEEPMEMHKKMAAALDQALAALFEIKNKAVNGELDERPVWPMIILRTPKGWTGPKYVDGKQIEGTFRAHQVPINPDSEEHIA